MADLGTQYMGLKLANPLVPSASPLSRDLDTARRLEDAGAAALVMYSLFEEEILNTEEAAIRFLHEQGVGHGEADSFLPVPPDFVSEVETYLEQLTALKSALDIPVIASLNGTSMHGWTEYGRQLQEAGADALELNVYHVAASARQSAAMVEARYVELLKQLHNHVTLPVTVKLSSQFSSLPHFVRQLQEAGADGVALFNRFYQPDIDLETLEVVPRLQLSTSQESLLRVRWTAILHGQVDLSLAVTGGMHTMEDVLKALLAGADVTHMCSALLQRGPGWVGQVLKSLDEWLDEHEYVSVAQLKGSISQQHCPDPAAYERANYVRVLSSFRPPGVRGEG